MKTKFKPGDIVQAEVKWTDAGSLIFEFIGEGKINRAGVRSDFFTLAPAKETPLQEAQPVKVGDMLQVEVVGIDRKGSALTLKHQSGISKYAIYFSRSEEYYDGYASESAPVVNTPLQEAERELIAATLDYRRSSRPDPVPAYSYPLILKVFEAADKVIALQAPPMTDLQIAISALEMLTTYFTVSDDDRVKIAQSALNKIKGSK